MTNLEWTDKPVEGDYLETYEGLLFTVKGLKHPEGLVIAYLRYIPDSNGNRVRGGRHYSRVYSIKKTTEYLSEKYPKYLNHIDSIGLVLQSVPCKDILRIYKPREYLKKIIDEPKTLLEEDYFRFVSELSNRSGVSLSHFGVSGSPLIGMDTTSSDIDLNVYGEDEGKSVYIALDDMRNDLDWVSPYNPDTITPILESRWGSTGLNINYFREIEGKKLLHGTVSGRDYFIRLLKPNESDETSKPIGSVKVRGFIEKTDSIFTPCSYQIRLKEYIVPAVGPNVSELVSFRGRFTEQVEVGSFVEVYGTLEEVTIERAPSYRIILGGPSDYLLPVKNLDR